jgi:hypothetical protein
MAGPGETPFPVPETPIPAGQARQLVSAAIVDVLSALARLEAIAVAVARGLDASVPARTEEPPMLGHPPVKKETP